MPRQKTKAQEWRGSVARVACVTWPQLALPLSASRSSRIERMLRRGNADLVRGEIVK
jgi:hypothetical protein